MNQTMVINFLIGIVLPGLIALLNQRRWPAPVKGLVAILVIVVTAAVVEWLRGTVTWADWRVAVVTIGGSALGMYRLWWKPSGIGPGIEAATSVDGRSSPPSNG